MSEELIAVVLKKRGRKSKKEMQIQEQEQAQKQEQSLMQDQVQSLMQDQEQVQSLMQDQDQEQESLMQESLNNVKEVVIDVEVVPSDAHVAKKRGRKPKGGKIIQQIIPTNDNFDSKPNVIMHLKCYLKDIQIHTSIIDSDVQSFNFEKSSTSLYEIADTQNSLNHVCYEDEVEYEDKPIKENDNKEVWKKLKTLEHNLHINNICDKKSACFWCTVEFDNPPIYIPKYFFKDSYHVYGCFCSPECATAYLMEENIDSSSKFERYHLINHIYSKIFDYKKNIKPAPNPYYMLEKYYGNLTIQEYRALLRNERLFLIVDKPLTRILPELHEDNDDFIINNKIIPSNTYQIKNFKKKQTKSNILTERFGLSK